MIDLLRIVNDELMIEAHIKLLYITVLFLKNGSCLKINNLQRIIEYFSINHQMCITFGYEVVHVIVDCHYLNQVDIVELKFLEKSCRLHICALVFIHFAAPNLHFLKRNYLFAGKDEVFVGLSNNYFDY